MTASRFITPVFQALDAKGKVLPGALLHFFEVGSSTTRKNTFTDATSTTENANPVIADGAGVFPNIYGQGLYRVVLQDKDGVQQWERDNVQWTDGENGVFSVDTVTDLRLFEPAFDNQVIFLLGLTTPGVGDGHFYFDATDTTTADDGVDVIVTTDGARWKRTDPGIVVSPGTATDAIATNLLVGTKVWTTGYNTANDRGANFYFVVASGTSAADGGSFIDMDNGNQLAGVFPDGEVHPEQFNLVTTADGVTALTNTVTYADAQALPVRFIEKATYTFVDQINATDMQLDIDGANSELLFSNAGVGIRFQQASFLRASATVDYTAGDSTLTVDDVTGVSIGDHISVVSTTLFNTERLNWFRGGNCIVTQVEGLVVSISMPFPFDMTAASLQDDGSTFGIAFTVPKYLKLKNITIRNSVTLPNGTVGVLLSKDVNSKLENVIVDNYGFACINFLRSVNSVVDQCETQRAFFTGSSTSYGLLLQSTTNSLTINSTISGGRVGLDTGGNEPTYNTTVENCFLTSSERIFGFSNHQQAYSNNIRNCEIFGLKVVGHTTVENCKIARNTGITDNLFIGVAENPEDNSYVFDQCVFLQDPVIRMQGDATEATTTRIHVGLLKIINCTGPARVVMDLEAGFGAPITAEIQKLMIENSDNISVDLNDNVSQLVLKDLTYSDDSQFLTQDTKGTIGTCLIDNCILAERVQVINIFDFNEFRMNNCSGVDISGSGSIFLDSATGVARIQSSDLSGFTSDITISTALDTLIVQNSNIEISSASLANITVKSGDFFFRRGLETGTTDASGDFTILHGMGFSPTTALLQVRGTTLFNVNVVSTGSTGVVVRAFDAGGSVLGSGVDVTVYWETSPS